MSESNEGRDSETSKRVELQESFNCGGEERRSCKQESGELAGDLQTGSSGNLPVYRCWGSPRVRGVNTNTVIWITSQLTVRLGAE